MHTQRTPLRLVALVLAALAFLAACGDSDDAGSGNELVEYFVSQEAPRDEAECVAGELGDFDSDEVIAALEGDEPPENAELIDALFGALTTCGVE
ncbi:MAG: hypothetical protein AAGA99_23450 [Actinomycetota bacterium]